MQTASNREEEIAAFLEKQQPHHERMLKDQQERDKRIQKEIDDKNRAALLKAEADIKESLDREAREAAVKERMTLAKKSIRYSHELADIIAKRVADGEMLKAICDDQSMPEMQTVLDWLEDSSHDFFQEIYMKACKRRETVFADELIMISDDSRNDYMDKMNSKTGESFRVLDPESLGRSKLRIDMRLKILKAFNPAVWGDNPSVADKTLRALEERRPQVVFNFIQAPQGQPGDNAKTIDATPVANIDAPRQKVAQ